MNYQTDQILDQRTGRFLAIEVFYNIAVRHPWRYESDRLWKGPPIDTIEGQYMRMTQVSPEQRFPKKLLSIRRDEQRVTSMNGREPN